MRKLMMLFIVFGMLFVVACSNEPEPDEDKEKQEQQVPEAEDDSIDQEEADESEEQEEVEKKEEEQIEPEAGNSEKIEKKEANKDSDKKAEKAEKEAKQAEKKSSNETGTSESELIDLGFDIFKAQKEGDFAFLESILAKGASIDKSSKTFSFEDVTYPHEQAFIQAKQSDVEYRYTHKEDETHIIVGFAVVDYDTESSYTIDFQFAKEKNGWKMKDMDMNK